MPGNFGGKVGHVAIREKKGGTEDYLAVNDGIGLLTCVQMGTIEFHGWGAPAHDVEHPDRMVFDLDPEEGLDFAEVRRAAQQLRDLLGEMGLASFPMASGGKGVHVVVPLDGKADWPKVKDFASRFSRAVAEAHPKRFTANMRKTERKNRIFLDWLRKRARRDGRAALFGARAGNGERSRADHLGRAGRAQRMPSPGRWPTPICCSSAPSARRSLAGARPISRYRISRIAPSSPRRCRSPRRSGRARSAPAAPRRR